MIRCRAILWITLLSQFLAIGSLAQEQRKIVTKTRYQVIFAERETQWLKAIQQKDTSALDRLLSEEFTSWSPATPVQTASREEWQTEAFKRPPQSFRIDDISVRGINPAVAVANFRLTETFGQGDSAQQESYYVVDVWVNSGPGENWKCLDRYISRIPVSSNPTDVKPTGKD
jgi:hypothetical protein